MDYGTCVQLPNFVSLLSFMLRMYLYNRCLNRDLIFLILSGRGLRLVCKGEPFGSVTKSVVWRFGGLAVWWFGGFAVIEYIGRVCYTRLKGVLQCEILRCIFG